MRYRPEEDLKKVAGEYARHLYQEGNHGGQSFREKLTFSEAPESAAFHHQGPASENGHIGIWKEVIADGKVSYQRDESMKDDFNTWIDRDIIHPKHTNKRVVYLGESVASGFFYEHHYRPALLAEKAVNQTLGEDSLEVIDLSKIGIDIDELRQVTRASLRLEPDALVVFAGNNWLSGFQMQLAEKDIRAIYQAVTSGKRFDEIDPIFQNKIREIAFDYLQLLKELDLPVIFVIPEFNLKDWYLDINGQGLLWPQGETEQWMTLKETAEQALEQNNMQEAREAALDLIRLNKSNTVGYRTLAESYLREEKYDEALQALLDGRDTIMYRMAPVPGTHTVLRDQVLELAKKDNLTLIDLPILLKEHFPGTMPDRSMFLDYCHFDDNALKLVASHLAKEILHVVFRRQTPYDELHKLIPPSEKKYKGIAHLMAAMYNAHLDQSAEVIRYHTRMAIDHFDRAAEFMMQYVDMVNRNIPKYLTSGYRNIKNIDELGIYFSRILVEEKVLDLKLVQAMLAELKERGNNMEARTEQLRLQEHGYKNGRMNLLDPYLFRESYLTATLDGRAYTSREKHTRFYAITSGEDSAEGRITLKLPKGVEGSVNIFLNEKQVAACKAGSEWSSHTFLIPAETFVPGVSTISVQWPAYSYTEQYEGDDPEAMSEWLIENLHPLYGLIHQFTLEKK
ncbi:MAG: hypothetical protein WBB45_09330 [Cyclobacteriaceae bacterium]